MSLSTRVSIIGAGALGTLFAGHLAIALAPSSSPDGVVALIGRKSTQHVRTLQRDGLRIERDHNNCIHVPPHSCGLQVRVIRPLLSHVHHRKDDDHHLDELHASSPIATAASGDSGSDDGDGGSDGGDGDGGERCLDLVIILTKTYDTFEAATTAARLLGLHRSSRPVPTNASQPMRMILSLQNGLGNAETILSALQQCQHYSPAHVMLCHGTTSQASSIVRPGIVFHAGSGPTIIARAVPEVVVADEIAASAQHTALQQVATLLSHAGIPTTLASYDTTHSFLWPKLVVNAAVNPLTALLRVRNGQLSDNPKVHDLMRGIIGEALAVANACAITLPSNLQSVETAFQHVLQVTRATSSNISSMLHDVLQRHPVRTEIEAINGAIVRLGVQSGVPTPINSTIVRLIQGIECCPLSITSSFPRQW